MAESDPLRKHCVTVEGPSEAGTAIVFVHGFGTDQRAWDGVAAHFADEFRIVRLDNAGAGRSDPAAFVQHRYLALDGYAHDLAAVCDALALRDAVIVGHSAGAMIALLTALRRPELASRLVLIGASPRYLDDRDYHGGFTKADLDATYSAVMHSYPQWADGFAPLAMGNPERPALSAHFAGSLKSIPPERALTVLCSIFQSDYRAEVRRLDKPTLLIQTHQDVAVPVEVAEYLHRHIRGSRLAVIDATGHLPHLSAPDTVAAAMRSFVRGG